MDNKKYTIEQINAAIRMALHYSIDKWTMKDPYKNIKIDCHENLILRLPRFLDTISSEPPESKR